MKTNRLFWALGWVTMGSLAALQGCGGDDDDGGTATGGSAGEDTGGTGGKATGGTAGKATGGTAGKATGGTAGKATGGTAGTAGTMPEGGMGGDGVGGEGGSGSDPEKTAACEDYCAEYYDQGCEAFDATNVYTSEANCNDVCVASTWAVGDPGDGAGNSVHCRLTHAGLAGMSDQDTHCGHASATSAAGQCS